MSTSTPNSREHGKAHPPAPDRLAEPRNPFFAAAFTTGSQSLSVDIGPGLRGVVRSSPSGDRHVLCVSNTADEPRTFRPDAYLPAENTGELVFLTGSMETLTSTSGYLLIRIPAGHFAWLGCPAH